MSAASAVVAEEVVDRSSARRGSFLFSGKRRKKTTESSEEEMGDGGSSGSSGSDARSSPGKSRIPVSLMKREKKKKKRKSKLSSMEDANVHTTEADGSPRHSSSGNALTSPRSRSSSGNGTPKSPGKSGANFITSGISSGITKIAKRDRTPGKEKKKKTKVKYKHRSSEDNHSKLVGIRHHATGSPSRVAPAPGTELDLALKLALKNKTQEPQMPTLEEMLRAEAVLNSLETPRVVLSDSEHDYSCRGSLRNFAQPRREKTGGGIGDDVLYNMAFSKEEYEEAECPLSPSTKTLSLSYLEAKRHQGLLTDKEAAILMASVPRTLPLGVLDAVVEHEVRKATVVSHLNLSQPSGLSRSLGSSSDVDDLLSSRGEGLTLDALCELSSGSRKGEEEDDDEDDLLLSDAEITEEELSLSCLSPRSHVSEREEAEDAIMDVSEPSSYEDDLVELEKQLRLQRHGSLQTEVQESSSVDEGDDMMMPMRATSQPSPYRRPSCTTDPPVPPMSRTMVIRAPNGSSSDDVASTRVKARGKRERQGEEKRQERESKAEKQERKLSKGEEEKKEEEEAGSSSRLAPPSVTVFRKKSLTSGTPASDMPVMVSVPVHEAVPSPAPDLSLDPNDSIEEGLPMLAKSHSLGSVHSKPAIKSASTVPCAGLGVQPRPADVDEGQLDLEDSLGNTRVVRRPSMPEESEFPLRHAGSSSSILDSRAVPLARRWELMLKTNMAQADSRVQQQRQSREEKLRQEMEQERVRLQTIKAGGVYKPQEASPPAAGAAASRLNNSAEAASPSAGVVRGRVKRFETLSMSITDATHAAKRLRSSMRLAHLEGGAAEAAKEAAAAAELLERKLEELQAALKQ